MSLSLNPAQREAAEAGDGPLLVLAGAGSGKTRVLAARAAFLVASRRAHPWQILALTFTNKAAGELRARVAAAVGEAGGEVCAGTFHGIFARILRQEGLNIGIDPHYTIIDEEDRRRLLTALMKEMGLPAGTIPPRWAAQQISRAKDAGLTPEEFAERASGPLAQALTDLFRRYQTRLKRASELDFDDLLLKPLRAMADHPDFLERLQNRFRYILVDEFQDTNRVQYQLVSAIAQAHRNLNVVGDDDQAIYSFRGATVANILEFQRDWPEARVVRLEQNYRSTQPILDVAWAVIRRNRHRHPKKLWTDRTQGAPVELVIAATDEDEARRFVAMIQNEHHLKGRAYGDVALLYRVNAQSLPFERALREAGVAYQVVGGQKFYERKEVKDLLAYLRVVLNPADDVSFLRVLNYPPRGIGPGTEEDLQARARAMEAPLEVAMGAMLADDELPLRTRNALAAFADLLADLRRQSRQMPLAEFAREVVKVAGLRERLALEEKEDPSRAESKLANLETLLDEIARYQVLHPEGSLAGFLEEVTLVSDVDRLTETADQVNLLTLHSAKGLEFPVVFIGGLEEGLLPLDSPDDSTPTDVEEERRLFYVGVTRAKERLVLGCAQCRQRWGATRLEEPSRFIAEIPPELLIQRGGAAPAATGWLPIPERVPKRSVTTIRSRRQLEWDAVHQGMLVRHPTFGLGVVVKVTRAGADSRAVVDFDDVGIKTLVLRLARLESPEAR